VTTTIDVRLRQIRLEAEGIVSFELADAAGQALPPFDAGAHIDLHLPGGLVRSYSLVNAPSERDRYVIAVRREEAGRGGSGWMHTVPRVCDAITISRPENDFGLVEDARHCVFIAGGIGITPFMSMLRRLNSLNRSWELHYAARSPRQAAFVRELQAMAGPESKLDLSFSAERVRRLDIARIVAEAPSDAHLYCCGPAGMIDDFLTACAGRAQAMVHVERFAAAAQPAMGGGFDVLLQRSGRRIAVPAGHSILDTLLDHAVPVQYSCCSGVCGTCMTRVLDGEPDHRDDYLTADEKRANESVMICCSGSRSATLVLDL
jgi:tetrachlorobenzoquinone reductase